jgi:anionic cell wall polymer biosynthesis LytR-Cps2A-Psr (LCP) family protein
MTLLFLGPVSTASSQAIDKSPDDNIIIFWTNGDSLKAVTLMCVRGSINPIGIITIPLQARVRCLGRDLTIAETYSVVGRQGITACLEELFGIPIGCYLSIDQATLNKVSFMIGSVSMDGSITTVADVFEGTYTNSMIDPQMEVRQLAARLVEPRVMIKSPQLIWILSNEVKTNLSCRNLIGIYRVIQERGPDVLNKKVLQGNEYSVGGRNYRDVPPEAWVKALQSAVNSI